MIPFNLEKYNGQAVCTSNGLDVEIIKTDVKSTYCIIGIIQCPDGTQIVDCFDKFGISSTLFSNNLNFKPIRYNATLQVNVIDGVLRYNLLVEGKDNLPKLVGDNLKEVDLIIETDLPFDLVKPIEFNSDSFVKDLNNNDYTRTDTDFELIKLNADDKIKKAIKVIRVDSRGHVETTFESINKAAKFVEMNQVTFKKKVMKHEKFSDGFYYIMEPDMEEFLLDLAEKDNGKESK